MKDAQNISRRTLSIRKMFYIFHVFNRDFSLAMDIWFKVMEKSWKSNGQNV